MKKILSASLTLLCFVFILVLPVLLGLHANMMSHHGMSAGDCVEHCMLSENQSYVHKIVSLSSYVEVLIAKTIFSNIFEYTISLVLLYLVLIYAPPNIYYRIKNYSYCSLIGVVKLTT